MEMTMISDVNPLVEVAILIGRIILVANVAGVIVATLCLLVVRSPHTQARITVPAFAARVFMGAHACIAILGLGAALFCISFPDAAGILVFQAVASVVLACLGLILWGRVISHGALAEHTTSLLGLSNEEHRGA